MLTKDVGEFVESFSIAVTGESWVRVLNVFLERVEDLQTCKKIKELIRMVHFCDFNYR
jgi:hypothetical protein